MELQKQEEQNTKTTARDKVFNFRPVFFCAVFLCFGIFFAYLRIYYHVSAWWSFTLFPVGILAFCFFADKKKIFSVIKAVCVLFFSFLIGFLAFSYQADDFDDCPRYDGEYTVVGKVEERTEYEDFTKLVLTDLHVGEDKPKGRLIAYLPTSFSEISLADKVLLKGYLQTKTQAFNGYGFLADAVGTKIRYQMSEVQSCKVTGKAFDPFAWVRERMISVVYAGMDESSASVTVAVLTGDTSGIETGLLKNVRYGGIAHIFAVSGLHIGALYAFCLLLYAKTPLKKLSKIGRFVLLAVVLLFYASVCGFSASVLRASILCLTSYAFTLLLVKTDFLEGLGFAGIIILLLSPSQLFAVGFQLSFGACLGIALLNRPILLALNKGYRGIVSAFTGKFGKKILQRAEDENMPPPVWERVRRTAFSFLSVSLSAQVATAPILLNAFGYLSVWGVLLNGIFVPLISATFSFLLVIVLTACLLPIGLSPIILYVPKVVWSVCLLLFEGVDFSSFVVSGIKLSFLSILLYGLLCTLFSDKWNLSKTWRWIGRGICLTALIISLLVLNL